MHHSAVISLVVGSANLGFYMFVDPMLRKDAAAKSREPSEHDKGTTQFIGVAFAVSWAILFLTALLNQFQIATIEPHLIFIAIGVVLMATGVVLRIIAMRTLGKFFTRTLRMREEHHVISDGIYRRIRHPGYLGDIVLFVGSVIATSNVLTVGLILGVILPAFVRRIATEERMLTELIGQEYSAYKSRTWKLIPFIY
jgi:protein-S-isoprenylcysteine O-methyltransferase Ste14